MSEAELPGDLRLEKDVIGTCLVRPDAIAGFGLTESDFSTEANRALWSALSDMAAAGERIDPLRLRSKLIDRNQLALVGGEPVLEKLRYVTKPKELPIERLKQFSKLRSLRAAAELVASTCVTGDLDASVSALADAHGAALSSVQKERTFNALDLCLPLLEELANGTESVPRVHPGYAIMEECLGSLPEGCTVAVLASTNVGKSTLALEMLLRAAERNVTCGYLSVEDQRPVVSSRLVGMLGAMSSRRILQRKIGTEDMSMMAVAFDKLNTIKERLHISILQGGTDADVCAALSELAAHGCKMVAVDYMQKIRASKSYSNKAHEISEGASRITSHAQRLGIVCILVSQCARDKTRLNECPSKHDMKECVTGEQQVMDSRTGDLIAVCDLVARENCSVFGINGSWKVGTAPVHSAWSTGVKPVFKLRTKSGRTIRATANHPLMMLRGWTRLDEIAVGSRIAVPRVLPEPTEVEDRFCDDDMRLLGYMISDGHYGKDHALQFVTEDPAVADDMRAIVRRFGVTCRRATCQGHAEQMRLSADVLGPRNNLIRWLKEIGIHGDIGVNKRIPPGTMRHSNRALAVLLGALWAGDGSVFRRKNGGWSLKFTNTSPELLDQVQWILLRLGIIGIREPWTRHSKSTVDIASILITEADAVIRFANVVPIVGKKGGLLKEAAAYLESRSRNARVDRLPIEVTQMVTECAVGSGVPYRFMKRDLGYIPQGKEMCRSDLATVAKTFDNDIFAKLADSDVLWDEVTSVEPDGEEEVFDLSVPGLNNFVVNGVFAHNSGDLENMVDAIIGMWREHEDDFAPIWAKLLKVKWGGVGQTWRLQRDPVTGRLEEVAGSNFDTPPSPKHGGTSSKGRGF